MRTALVAGLLFTASAAGALSLTTGGPGTSGADFLTIGVGARGQAPARKQRSRAKQRNQREFDLKRTQVTGGVIPRKRPCRFKGTKGRGA